MTPDEDLIPQTSEGKPTMTTNIDESARWRRIADERLGKLAAIARIGAEPPSAVLAIIQDRETSPSAGTSDTSTIHHESLDEFRRELVEDAESWRALKERYAEMKRGTAAADNPALADSYAGALMASHYAYTLAAILRVAADEMGPQTARRLANVADDILDGGGERDLNADVRPGTPLPPPTPLEQRDAGQLSIWDAGVPA